MIIRTNPDFTSATLQVVAQDRSEAVTFIVREVTGATLDVDVSVEDVDRVIHALTEWRKFQS